MAILNDNDSDESCGPGDKCWNGAQGKINKGKPMVAFKRKRKPKPDNDSDDKAPAAGLNMNVRDLGNSSGQVQLHPKDNKSSFTQSQLDQGAAMERSLAKKKGQIAFKKKIGL